MRHMHREYSAYFNPTCAPCAPCDQHTFDSLFDLCRASGVNTQTSDERSGDNPSIVTKLTTRTKCMLVT